MASPRMQGLSLGPADLAANRRMKTTRVGGGHPDYLVREDPSIRRSRRAAADAPAGPVALHDLADGRRVRLGRDPAVLRPVRRHRRHRRLRRPVPQRLPPRLRRGVEPAPRADRHRQAGVLAPPVRRRPGPTRHRRDGRRHRSDHARRQDGGRRIGQAVPGRGRARPSTGGTRSRARDGLRVRADHDRLPTAAIGAVHAGRQRARPREGQDDPRRRADLRPRGRGRPGRQAGGARPGVRGRGLRCLRPPRDHDPVQRARHRVGCRRPPRRGDERGRGSGDPEGRFDPRPQCRVRRARHRRRAGGDVDLGDDRDADRRARRARDRRSSPGRQRS